MEPLLKDPPRKGQPRYKGHFPYLQHAVYFYMDRLNTLSTSEKRTASLHGTKQLAPKCPFIVSSTVLTLHYMYTATCTLMYCHLI